MKGVIVKGGNAAVTKIMKQDAEKRLADVSSDYAFWCNDGRIIRSVRELKEALEQMNDAIYIYHANAEKNDFSTWVKEVILDEKLARDLAKAGSRVDAARCVAARIAFLSSKL